jgi:hypothetical protein
MAARITIPEEDTLDGEVGKLADEWKSLGHDRAFLRMLSHRSDLVSAFFKFYLPMRVDGLVSAKLKELARLRIAGLNTCRY